MRILEKEHIKYDAISYGDNSDHILEHGAAGTIAEKLGLDASAVFKTIVMRTDSKEICVFCQNALNEINLKKARSITNSKEITPVKPEELLNLTGYIRGGCSPLGMKHIYRTFIDQEALAHDKIYVSAGIRGLQICLAPQDLIKVTNAQICDLVL